MIKEITGEKQLATYKAVLASIGVQINGVLGQKFSFGYFDPIESLGRLSRLKHSYCDTVLPNQKNNENRSQ